MKRSDRLVLNIEPTEEEMAAVLLGADRMMAIWDVCDAGTHYRSPNGMPTADDAIRPLGVRWTRQVSLLNLALEIAAERKSRSLGNQQRKFVA